MKKTIKRTSALLLVLLISAMMLIPLNVQAVSPPGEAYWNGKQACWTASPDSDVIYYVVNIYADDAYINTASPSSTYLDCSTIIDAYPGSDFYFTVEAVTGGDSPEHSIPTYSGTLSTSHHHIMVHHDFSKPTCTEKGCKGYYVCTECGRWYWDEAAGHEIFNHDDVYTDALGHNWGDWKITKDPTVEAEGEARRVCQNDSSHVETKTLPKLKAPDEKPKLPTEKPTEKKKETTAPATTAPATTAPSSTTPSSSVSSTAPTLNSTLPTSTDGSGTGIGNSSNLWIFIVVGIILLLFLIAVPVTIILIIVFVRKKKRNQPPTDPDGPQPPQNQPPQDWQQQNQQPQNWQQQNQQPQNWQQQNQQPQNWQQQNQQPQNWQQQNQQSQNWQQQNQQPQNWQQQNQQPQNWQQQNQQPQNWQQQNQPPQNWQPNQPNKNDFNDDF